MDALPDLLKYTSGTPISVVGILLIVAWAFYKKLIVPGSLYEAEREARIKAEEREREILKRLDKTIDLAERTLPRGEGSTRQP